MKHIYCCQIELSPYSYHENGDSIYEVNQDSEECEYSDEWFVDSDDPIKDYVENAIENAQGSFEDSGYSWDEEKEVDINFKTVITGTVYHVLFQNGVPVELYYVGEGEDEETEKCT